MGATCPHELATEIRQINKKQQSRPRHNQVLHTNCLEQLMH